MFGQITCLGPFTDYYPFTFIAYTISVLVKCVLVLGGALKLCNLVQSELTEILIYSTHLGVFAIHFCVFVCVCVYFILIRFLMFCK